MSSWEIKGILEGSGEDDTRVGQPYCLRAFQAGDPLTLSFLVYVKQAFFLYKVSPAQKNAFTLHRQLLAECLGWVFV